MFAHAPLFLLLLAFLAPSARAWSQISFTEYSYYGPKLPKEHEPQICNNRSGLAFRETHMWNTPVDKCICDPMPDPDPRCHMLPRNETNYIFIQYDSDACSGSNTVTNMGPLNTWYVCCCRSFSVTLWI